MSGVNDSKGKKYLGDKYLAPKIPGQPPLSSRTQEEILKKRKELKEKKARAEKAAQDKVRESKNQANNEYINAKIAQIPILTDIITHHTSPDTQIYDEDQFAKWSESITDAVFESVKLAIAEWANDDVANNVKLELAPAFMRQNIDARKAFLEEMASKYKSFDDLLDQQCIAGPDATFVTTMLYYMLRDSQFEPTKETVAKFLQHAELKALIENLTIKLVEDNWIIHQASKPKI